MYFLVLVGLRGGQLCRQQLRQEQAHIRRGKLRHVQGKRVRERTGHLLPSVTSSAYRVVSEDVVEMYFFGFAALPLPLSRMRMH